jgi:hypothetical protein
MKINHLRLVLVFCTMIIVIPCKAASTNSVPDVATTLKIIAAKPKTREEHLAKVEAIKSVARMQNPGDALVNVLLDNLHYIPRLGQPSMFNPMEAKKYEFLPARDALLDIGDPVIPVLVKRIGLSDNEEERRVYGNLLGDFNKQKGQDAIKKALVEAGSDAEKARYKEFLRE